MKDKKSKILYSALMLMSLFALTACSSNASSIDSNSSSSDSSQKVTSVDTANSDSLSADIDWDSLPTKEVSLTDEGFTITEAGTYILTGSTTGGVTVNSDGNVRIILAGADIASTDSAALYVEAAKTAVIELQSNTENSIKDASSHSDSNVEGALHSKSDLVITGSGSLTVEGNYQDGIVSKDNLLIASGTITVQATDDAIRGKDSLQVTGGIIDVTAGGDGLKATNDEDITKGYTRITGGSLTVKAGDDGIKAESSLIVDGGSITVSDSAEAMEGMNVTITGGSLDLYATDDGINAASDVAGADIFIKVTGGDIKVEVAQGDTDAFDSNGDIYVSGGTIAITAQFAFDFDGRSEFTGGSITVNGTELTEIVADGPGAGGGPGGGQRPGW